MDQLEDVILSTLEEIQESIPKKEPQKQVKKIQKEKEIQKLSSKSASLKKEKQPNVSAIQKPQGDESELLFLNSLRERMLVLFEGFQAPNNTALEAKIDLTLNFLEYVLASIDTRIEQIKGK